MTGLIFDCDGVLADTERDGHRVAFNHVFAEQGVGFAWTAERYADALQTAGGKERLRALLTPQFLEQHGMSGDDAAVDELVAVWHKRKTEIFVSMLAAGEIPPRAGVRRLAEQAAESGWRLAVASTSAHVSVRSVLDHVMGPDLARDFTVFAGDDVGAKKPAPDIYLLALSRMQMSPSEAVVIEDSAIGVRAARAAGVRVVATTSAYTAEEDLSAARVVVDSLGEPRGVPLRVLKNESGLPIVDSIDLCHLEHVLQQSA